MKKKLPHEFSIEDLLASLETDNEDIETSYEFDSPVLSFIQAFNIVAGEEMVSDDVLYQLFRQWHRQGAWTKKTFNVQLAKYIPFEQKGHKFYKVNKSILYIAQKVNEIVRKKQKDKRKSITWQKHFERFVADTQLEKGNKIWVEADILYYVYNRWLDTQSRSKGTVYIKFLDIMTLYFERKIGVSFSNLNWFYVSRNIAKLITKEEVERWREGRKKKNATKNEEDKKHHRGRTYKTKYRGKTLYQRKEKKPKIGRPSKRAQKRIHAKKQSGSD